MARSHPPTLLTVAERTLREECRLERGERILVAVSGGGDSSALLHVLTRLGPRFGITVVAHGVDHGLRPEAAAELDLVEALANRLGVIFERTRVDVGAGGNLQARARDERRRALDAAKAKVGGTRIATAHHADDRAETVLIRLLHGARPSGLGVLPAVDGPLLRPLIRARRSDVSAHLARHEIPFATDPSNQDRRYLRVRVRLEVLPLLEQLSPGIVSHLNALADELRAANSGSHPLPASLDESGLGVPLRRAHRKALERALDLGLGARIRVSNERELVVGPRGEGIRLESGGPFRRDGERGPLGQKGGAKTGKSG
jgi:tRNA(Ile)-lysidine synthase